MAKSKGKSDAPAISSDRKWEVRDALQCLTRAEEVKSDPKLMKEVAALAEEQEEVAKRATSLAKRGLISDKQREKMEKGE